MARQPFKIKILHTVSLQSLYNGHLTYRLGATAVGYRLRDEAREFANDLYYSMCVVGWRGSSALYFDTSYPYGQNTNIPFNYQEKISYTQALCSWAIYEFAHSAYLTASDYSSSICEPCIDYILSVTRGSWGGMYFCPFVGDVGQSQDEFAGYSGSDVHCSSKS